MKRFVLTAMACAFGLGMMAQKEAQQLADSIVKYQMASGGWPKNQNWLKGVKPEDAREWARTGIGSTIDNGATTTELDALAKAVDQVVQIQAREYKWLDKNLLKERYKTYTEAFRRGVDFLLAMQYESGGFPQFYPEKKKEAYASQITFNDNAMVSAMRVLRDVANDAPRYRHMGIGKSTKKKCQAAYERGIRCILLCQIRVDESGEVVPYGAPSWRDSKPTVWCQQHDKRTFVPVKARAYELPSFTGYGETCGILDLLMDEPDPSAEVMEAVRCGVEWLETHAMRNVAVERFTNEDGEPDIRLVEKPDAPLLWARYYDLEKAEPMFCDRDGVPRKHLSEIGYERRNGYSWVGDGPKRVIERYKRMIQEKNH